MYHCPFCDPDELEHLGYRCTKCHGYFQICAGELVGLSWHLDPIKIVFNLESQLIIVYRFIAGLGKPLFRIPAEKPTEELISSLHKRATKLLVFS